MSAALAERAARWIAPTRWRNELQVAVGILLLCLPVVLRYVREVP